MNVLINIKMVIKTNHRKLHKKTFCKKKWDEKRKTSYDY